MKPHISINNKTVNCDWGNYDLNYYTEREVMTRPITTHFNLRETNGLDIGCGKRKSLPTAIGVDYARGFNEREDVNNRDFIIPDLLCDARDLPFRDETIDWITSAHNFEHYDNPVEVLLEWLRVLKSGGVISMIIPTGRGDTGDVDHKHHYTPENFMEKIGKHFLRQEIKIKDLKNDWSFHVEVWKR